jgi:seryl-tRNA synthetase
MQPMLDRRFIRENPTVVQDAIDAKGIDLDLQELLRLDQLTRTLQGEVDQKQAERKAFSKKFARADDTERERLRQEHQDFDADLQDLRDRLAKAAAQLEQLLLLTPGIPWRGAPIGDDESANVTIRIWGQAPQFDFEPIDHTELVTRRDWAEFARARTASGERAYALKGDLVLLERAVQSYALDILLEKGFTPISVPVLVKESALVGTGMFPKGREETYELPNDDLFLAGTSEVGLVGIHSGEILSYAELPLRYAGISPCFRREVGSAGRDVRGLLRVHQFEKVEQFVVCEADAEVSAYWHAALLTCAEDILQAFGLHYEVVECCTGDMGLGKFRMNDINTWMPSLLHFRETHSCSTLHDWQARRASIRYRDEDGRVQFAHTLNNTAVATPRLLAALLENHQTEDHRVRIPAVLRPYLGGREEL